VTSCSRHTTVAISETVILSILPDRTCLGREEQEREGTGGEGITLIPLNTDAQKQCVG